jgi:Zn-dependent M28 family amino/carboxypeptidase
MIKQGFTVTDKGRNIIATLEGKTPDKYIVLCATYDALGKKGDTIYPGAIRNASGTAALLEVARAFGSLAENGVKPEMGIIFAFLGADEIEGWGSQYFVENLKVFGDIVIQDIKGVVIFDMLGSGGKDKDTDTVKLSLHTDLPPVFNQAVGEAGKMAGLRKIEVSQSFPYMTKGPQQVFWKAGIGINVVPTMLFHSGDYIQMQTSKDTIEIFDSKKAETGAKIGFCLAWLLTSTL